VGIFDQGGAIGPVFEGRARRKQASAAAAARAQVIGGLDIGVDELVASTADPERAAAFQDQFRSYSEMALSSDPELQREGMQGLAQIGSAVRSALETQRVEQRGLVVEAATDMREKAQQALRPMRELQASVEQINAILADPGVDVTNPLYRNQLISLIGSTSRQMLADPADLADALRSVNGGGLLGSIVGLVGGALAAEDFKWTREDYRRLADAAYVFQRQKYQSTVAPIERDAHELEQAASQLDVFPPGYSLTRYVLSQPEDFTNPLLPSYPEAIPAQPTLGTAASGLSRFMESLTTPEAPSEPAAGEPAGAMPPTEIDVGRWQYNPNLPKQATGLFNRMASMPTGTTFKLDPKTGRVWAYAPDGNRTEVETTSGFTGLGGERGALLEWWRKWGGK
jgi:hypothetical protein